MKYYHTKKEATCNANLQKQLNPDAEFTIKYCQYRNQYYVQESVHSAIKE